MSAVKSGFNCKRQRLRKPNFEQLEKDLKVWFLRCRNNNVPITRAIIKTKAEQLHAASADASKPFTASNGWISRFVKRQQVRFYSKMKYVWCSNYLLVYFQLRSLEISGEKLSSDSSAISSFKIKLAQIKDEMGLTDDQIYNADETGLFYNILCDRTYVSLTANTAPGMKIDKSRVTMMGCVNASGSHKLKPLIIGKFEQPRCLRNYTNSNIDYRHSKRSG